MVKRGHAHTKRTARYGGMVAAIALLSILVSTICLQGPPPSTLREAIIDGDVESVRSFLRFSNGEIANSIDGEPVLSYAIQAKRPLVAITLIELGARINDLDGHGHAPLHYAVLAEMVQVARELLRAGARVDVSDVDGGRTPLMLAADAGNGEMLEVLLDHGAGVDKRDLVGRVPLHYAVKGGNIECVNAIIDTGTQIDSSDSLGETPLIYACRYSHFNKKGIVERLLKAGANALKADMSGASAAHYAIRANDIDILEIMGGSGVPFDSTEEYEWSILHEAALHSNVQTVETICQFVSSIDVLDADEITPLMIAVERGDVAIASMLVKHGANVARIDSSGRSVVDRLMQLPPEARAAVRKAIFGDQ